MVESTTFKMIYKSKDLTLTAISRQMHVAPNTLGYKLNGIHDLSGQDFLDLQQIVAPELSIEELFPEICAMARTGLVPVH